MRYLRYFSKKNKQKPKVDIEMIKDLVFSDLEDVKTVNNKQVAMLTDYLSFSEVAYECLTNGLPRIRTYKIENHEVLYAKTINSDIKNGVMLTINSVTDLIESLKYTKKILNLINTERLLEFNIGACLISSKFQYNHILFYHL